MESRNGGEGRCLYTLSDGRAMLTVVEVPPSFAAGSEASLCGKGVRLIRRDHPFWSVNLIDDVGRSGHTRLSSDLRSNNLGEKPLDPPCHVPPRHILFAYCR